MDIASLIEVRAPYFALTQLVSPRPGLVRAVVDAEQPRHEEAAVVGAAETGRHLAILGSCACATLAPELGKHFYLANRALFVRSPEADDRAPRTGLVAEAQALSRDKRKASARTALRDAHGRTLYSLDVSYQVLSERLFERMFAQHRRELPDTHDNPYRRSLPLTLTRLTPYAGQAVLPEVLPELCAGHFPLYPAMPIAFLMSGLVWLSSQVLSARVGAPTPFVTTRAEVSADNLAFAGQSLTFESEWLGSASDHDRFEARARLANGLLAGTLELTVQRKELADQPLQEARLGTPSLGLFLAPSRSLSGKQEGVGEHGYLSSPSHL